MKQKIKDHIYSTLHKLSSRLGWQFRVLRIYGLLACLTITPVMFNSCTDSFKTSDVIPGEMDLSSTSEPLSFDLHQVPPSSKIGFILRGACLKGSPLKISIDGIDTYNVDCANGQFAQAIDLPGADGPKVIVGTTSDPGRKYQASVTVIKDTTAPALDIINIVPMSGYVVVSGTCEVGLPLEFGGDILSLSANTCSNGSFQVSAYLTAGTAAAKILELQQIDKAGNVGNDTMSWNPDTTPPTLLVSSPANNSYVKSTALTLSGVCETGLSVQISGAGLSQTQSVSCASGTFSANLTLTSADGAKALIIKQTDAAQNVVTVNLSVIKDSVAPQLTITSPAMNASVTSTSLTVAGACETGLPVMLQGSGLSSSVQFNCSNSAFSGSVILLSGTGSRSFEARQTDQAGNMASVTRSISVTTPTSNLAISQPAANSLSKGSVTISGVCDNTGTISFSGDIQAASNVTCASGAYSRALTLSSGEGLKTVIVQQVVSGVTSMVSRSFTKDSIAPAITLSQPADNAVVKGNVSVSGVCESGLSVALQGAGLSASSTATCTNGAFSASLTLSNGDGNKSFTASQTDAAGNVGTVTKTVVRDSTNPTLSIVSPANGSYVGSDATLTGACENGITVSISGAGLSAATTATCSLGMYSKLVTFSSGEGSKVIKAEQTDSAGNIASVSVTLNKDTVKPNLTITDPAANTSAEAGLTVKGACENGLQVKASGSGVASAVTANCASQAYSIAITFSTGDGNKTVTISQTDAAGNVASVNRVFVKAAAPGTQFASAKAVFNNYCISCHKAGGQASGADFTSTNESDFISRGFVVPGNPDQSKIVYRMVHYSGSTVAGARNMPLGYSTSNFPLSAYNTIVAWVSQMSVPQEPPPVVTSFACADPAARSNTLSYVLTKVQYQNSLQDIFGATVLNAASNELSTLPTDVFDESYRRTSALSPAKIQAYFNIAKTVANTVVTTSSMLTAAFGSCAAQSAPATTCIDTYLNSTAKRLFRRPLTTDEINFAKQIANRGGDYKTNLKAVLSYHLQSPAFLWRVELGKSSQSSTTLLSLTPYEVATRLSYMTIDSTPDSDLMAAADGNQLSTTAQLQAQVRRLLLTTRGRDKLKKNIMRWSLTDRAEDLSSLPAELRQGVDVNGLSQAMVDEAGTFIEQMVYSQNASFKTLLTSKNSYASHAGLAQIYGHAPASVSAPAQFTQRRQGILMRAPALAWPRTRTGIIIRGVKFQKQVLCNEIPPPSSVIADLRDAADFTPEEKLLNANRDNITHQTRDPVCMSCHATINPTGFAFENFDSFGRVRTIESVFDSSGNFVRNVSINTASEVPLASGGTLPVTDGYDLVTYIATSAEGSACFSRNVFRYVNEKRETDNDNCQLDKVNKIVSDTNKPLLDAMVELIANDVALVKKK